MNNYQDNLNKYKYNSTDIFNSNAQTSASPQKQASRIVKQDAQKSDIFSLTPSTSQQVAKPIKAHQNQSTVFSKQPLETKEIAKPIMKINQEQQQKKSDIFMQSPDRNMNNKPQKKLVTQNPSLDLKQGSGQKDFGKKMQTETKREDHKNLIFTNDMSYIVKKDKTKDFSTAEQNMQQQRDRYVVANEKFGFVKSTVLSGDSTSALYQNFVPTDSHNLLKKEKGSFNAMWWNDSNSRASVNERAVFDKNYAREKHNKDMQSQIFMSKDDIQQHPSRKAELDSQNNQRIQQSQQQEQQGIDNRKQMRNFSDLNGFQQQRPQYNDNRQRQQGLIPSNLKSLNHDSNIYKFQDAGNQKPPSVLPQDEVKSENGDDKQDKNGNTNVATKQYQKEMKSSLDTHKYEAEYKLGVLINGKPQQQHAEKFQNFQVIEDFDNLDEAPLQQPEVIVVQNQSKVMTKQEKEIEASNYNYQNSGKKGKQITQDPQRIEEWEKDPYKDRVSLLQQKKQKEIEVKLIELDLKGLNEKFDLKNFKKICARKGYHLVDLDVNYNFNKMTGRGKLILRNSRKITDGPDSIKQHLKSLGIGVTKESERDATMENNKVKLEADASKKKLFSQPDGKPGTASRMSVTSSQQQQTVASEQGEVPQVKKVSGASSRLYQQPPKKEKESEAGKENINSVKKVNRPQSSVQKKDQNDKPAKDNKSAVINKKPAQAQQKTENISNLINSNQEGTVVKRKQTNQSQQPKEENTQPQPVVQTSEQPQSEQKSIE